MCQEIVGIVAVKGGRKEGVGILRIVRKVASTSVFIDFIVDGHQCRHLRFCFGLFIWAQFAERWIRITESCGTC